MISSHFDDEGRWFLGSLYSNKCDFMRVVRNLLGFCMAKYPINFFRLTDKNTSDDKNNILYIL